MYVDYVNARILIAYSSALKLDWHGHPMILEQCCTTLLLRATFTQCCVVGACRPCGAGRERASAQYFITSTNMSVSVTFRVVGQRAVYPGSRSCSAGGFVFV